MSASISFAACGICGSTRVKLLYSAIDRNRRVDDRRFQIILCCSCHIARTVPMLSAEELSRYYPIEYYGIDNTIKTEQSKLSKRYRRIRMERILRYRQSGRLLDIGAGTGMFLKTARDFGFDVEGLEISADAAAFGRNTWGLNIAHGDLLKTTFPSDQFDVVTLGHVYEHLHDPRGAAEQLLALLKPGGLLVVAVPNLRSIQAKIFQERWFHLDVPRHLFHYSPTGMQYILEQAGFRTLSINFFSPEHNWAGILGSMMQLSGPNESTLHKAVRKVIGTPAARIIAHVESAVSRGGTFELYATKP